MKYDIIVVGAGIIGLSSAYYLKTKYPDKDVLLVEKNPGPGQENSTLNAGGFRNVYTSRTNFLLADSTVEMYKHIQNGLHYDLGMEPHGYLWLLTESKYKEAQDVVGDLKRKNVKVDLVDREELKKVVPGLVLDFDGDKEARNLGMKNIEGGLMACDAGVIDNAKLVRFYEDSFKKRGGKTMYGIRIVGLIVEPEKPLGVTGEPLPWQEIKVVGVRTPTQEIYGDVVLAVGPWAPSLLDPIGIDCMFRPAVRSAGFILKPKNFEHLKARMGFSFLFLPPKIRLTLYRNEGYLTTFSLRETWPFGEPLGLEEVPTLSGQLRDYDKTVHCFLKKYLPIFEEVRPVDLKRPGQYQVNSLDGNPWILKKGGITYAGGMSGSGLHKADAVGRIVAALYGGDEYAELFGGRKFKVSDLGIEKRNVDREYFVM